MAFGLGLGLGLGLELTQGSLEALAVDAVVVLDDPLYVPHLVRGRVWVWVRVRVRIWLGLES